MRTPDEIFIDYCSRRRGILKALTADVDEFYNQCSPDKENLCLYGYSDGSWEVSLPADEVPPELPEPTLGINFARDGMRKLDWLSLIAVHSDSWLMAISFYNAAKLDAAGRRKLFNDINSLPTCYEIVSGRVGLNSGNNDSGGATAAAAAAALRAKKRPRQEEDDQVQQGEAQSPEEDEDGDEDDVADAYEGGDPCPNCGRLYQKGEFWIQCDVCDRWFDGKCVSMNSNKADRSGEWKCPFCSRV